MLQYNVLSSRRNSRPLSRLLLVGSNVIVFLAGVYIVDARIDEFRKVDGRMRVAKSSIIPVDLVVRQPRTAVKESSARPARKPVRAYHPRGVFDAVRPWLPYINKYAREYGVDPDLVSAVLYIESKGDPYSVSPRGALGLMQLTPPTAKYLGVSDALDPEENIRGGVKYLAWLINRYDEPSALLAYNAGMGMLEQNRIPRETRQFLEKVMSLRTFLKESKKQNDLS
jgi:soluble lytic murein transglycosylase-like protein